MHSNPKQLIIDLAHKMGFERAVVASMEPLQAERRFYEEWLRLGYAASMDYLKRDPEKRNSPRLLCPEAYSAIVLFASYYTKPPRDPGPQFGRIASYAVGRDYHSAIPARLEGLKLQIEEKLQRPLLGKFFTDDVQLFEQGLASRHGLGFTGKNSLLIGPRLSGSYFFVAEFFTDMPLEADEPYAGSCGNCFRCGIACPTAAIVEEQLVDANRCISFLTIENKGEIPRQLREKLGPWLFGCDVCQEVCPYNQRPTGTSWEEFQPESGVGHYLNLFDLLKINDKREFLSRFSHTPLSRPKRKGLLRNALVVFGNRRPEGGAEAIYKFLEQENDPLLTEHGAWALSRYADGAGYLSKLYDQQAESNKVLLKQYM